MVAARITFSIGSLQQECAYMHELKLKCEDTKNMSKILQRIQLNNQSINIGFCPNVYLTNVFSIKQQRQNEVQVRQYFHSPIHKGTLRKMGKNLNLSVSLVQILRSTIKTTNL